MGKRVRLTDQRRNKERRAVEDNIPYPGTVNQPGRQFKRHRQYDNWVEVVNHPLPDMRHEWKEDARNEIGFPLPKVASVRSAANKAVKLAVLLLGDKTNDRLIEAQARDFVRLGNKALERTLKRYAATESLYAQDEEEGDEEVVEEEVTAQEEGEEEAEEEVTAQEEEEAEEEETAGKKSGVAELDIELTAADDEEIDEEEDEVLASLYAQEDDDDDDDEDDEVTAQDEEEGEEEEAEEEVTAQDEEEGEEEEAEEEVTSKRKAKQGKKGVKSLGAQPRIAARDESIDEISQIWKDAPDVGKLFND